MLDVLYRVQAARWIFFYRLDSIHIQPSLGELQTLVNVFRDFAVSGPKCTEFAAELASYVPTSIYHARLRVVGIRPDGKALLLIFGESRTGSVMISGWKLLSFASLLGESTGAG